MKATREEKFTPVTLTLETQEEVDGVFALFNHHRISEAVGLRFAYKSLEPYSTARREVLHSKLKALLK